MKKKYLDNFAYNMMLSRVIEDAALEDARSNNLAPSSYIPDAFLKPNLLRDKALALR